MTQLIIFPAKFSNDQMGYDQAKASNEVTTIDIDESSYSALYNVQNSINCTAGHFGAKVNIGAIQTIQSINTDLYISMSDIDNTTHTMGSYDDLEAGFTQACLQIETSKSPE